MPRKLKGFFEQTVRPEDELARQRDVEALIAPRRLVAHDLPVARIRPNPFQARRNFDGLEELAKTIKVQGFTTRLRVRPDPSDADFFQLVFGERRLRAAMLAGMEEVPAEIAEHDDDEMIEIGLAENIQRRDLDPLEEAHAFRMLIDQRAYSVRRLAERIGKDKSYIEDRLALLRTPEDVQEMVAQRPDTMRTAREISKLATPEIRQPLIEAVVAEQLNTQDVRGIVREVVVLPNVNAMEVRERVARVEHDRADGIQRRPAPDINRAMERDVQALRAVLGRLDRLLPALAAADQAALIQYLAQLHNEIAAMAKRVKQMSAE